jgi:hypothetical protein
VHLADIPRIAIQVRSDCRNWESHNQVVQDDLSRITGIPLPRPDYLKFTPAVPLVEADQEFADSISAGITRLPEAFGLKHLTDANE